MQLINPLIILFFFFLLYQIQTQSQTPTQIKFCYRGPGCIELNDIDFLSQIQNISSIVSKAQSIHFQDLILKQEYYIKLLSQEFKLLRNLSFKPKQNNIFQEQINLKNIVGNVLTPTIIQTIFTSSFFKNLEILDLQRTSLQYKHFKFLQKYKSKQIITNIKSFNLNHNFLEQRAFQLLQKISFTQKIEHIKLNLNSFINKRSIQCLKNVISQHNQTKINLKTLSLAFTSLQTSNILYLLDHLNTSSLEYLDLSRNAFQHSSSFAIPFNNSLFKYLASQDFISLTTLKMNDMDLDEEQIQFIKNWKLPSLQYLDLSGNFITDNYFKRWITSKNMPKLKSFNIIGNDFSDQAIRMIVDNKFSDLEQLRIGKNRRLTQNHMNILGQIDSKKWRCLCFENSYITDKSLQNFFRDKQFPNLQILRIFQSMSSKSETFNFFQYIDQVSMGKLKYLDLRQKKVQFKIESITQSNVSLVSLKRFYFGGFDPFVQNLEFESYIIGQQIYNPDTRIMHLLKADLNKIFRNIEYIYFQCEVLPLTSIKADNLVKNMCIQSQVIKICKAQRSKNNYYSQLQIIKFTQSQYIYNVLMGYCAEDLQNIINQNSADKSKDSNQLIDFGDSKDHTTKEDQQSKIQGNNDNIFQPQINIEELFQCIKQLQQLYYIGHIQQLIIGMSSPEKSMFLSPILWIQLPIVELPKQAEQIIINQKLTRRLVYLRSFYYTFGQGDQNTTNQRLRLSYLLCLLELPLLRQLQIFTEQAFPFDNNDQHLTKYLRYIFTHNPNLIIINLQNSNYQCKFFQTTFKNLRFPYLDSFLMNQNQLEIYCLKQFLSINNLVKRLQISSNFIQNGLFEQLIYKNQITLYLLQASDIQLGNQQFQKFSLINRQFLRLIILYYTDFNYEGIQNMVKNINSTESSKQEDSRNYRICPKCQFIFFNQNYIGQKGIKLLFQNKMPFIQFFEITQSIDINILNSLFSYIHKIKSILVENHIFNLSSTIDSRAGRNLNYIGFAGQGLKQNDFRAFSNMNFLNLQQMQIQLYNVYDCEILSHLIKISKYSDSLVFSVQNPSNKKQRLTDQCLKNSQILKFQQIPSNKKKQLQFVMQGIYVPRLTTYLFQKDSPQGKIALSNSFLGDEIFIQLIQRLDLSELQLCYLDSSYLTSRSVHSLFSRINIQKLQMLDLSNNELISDFMEPLINKSFANLNYLFVQKNPLDDKFIQNLITINFPSLYTMSIKYTDITIKGLKMLYQLKAPLLQLLIIDFINVSYEQILDFIKDYPCIKDNLQQGLTLIFKTAINQNKYQKLLKITNSKNCNFDIPQLEVLHLDNLKNKAQISN